MRKERAGEERGALLLEAALAAAIVAGLAVFTGQILLRYHDGLREEASARYIEQVWRAAQDYAAEDAAFRDGAASAMLLGAAGQIGEVVDVPALQTAGHLPASFPDRDPFGAVPEIVFSSVAHVPDAARMLQAAVLMRNAGAPWVRERAGRIISLVTPRISGPAGHVRAGNVAVFPGGTAMAVPGAQAGDIVALAALPLVSGTRGLTRIVDVTPDFSGEFTREDLARALGAAVQAAIGEWRADKIQNLTVQDFRDANREGDLDVQKDLDVRKVDPSSDPALQAFLNSYQDATARAEAQEIIDNAEITDIPVHDCPSGSLASWKMLRGWEPNSSFVTVRWGELMNFKDGPQMKGIRKGYIAPSLPGEDTAVWRFATSGTVPAQLSSRGYRGQDKEALRKAFMSSKYHKNDIIDPSSRRTQPIQPDQYTPADLQMGHDFFALDAPEEGEEFFPGLSPGARPPGIFGNGRSLQIPPKLDGSAWRVANFPQTAGFFSKPPWRAADFPDQTDPYSVPPGQVEIRPLAPQLPRNDAGKPLVTFKKGDQYVSLPFASDEAAGYYVHRPGACNHGLPVDLNTRSILQPCHWLPTADILAVDRTCTPETTDIHDGLAFRLKKRENVGKFDSARSLRELRSGN